MLYDLSKHYHVFEKKRMEALERFKGDEDMTNWLYEFEKGVYETSLNFDHTLRDWFCIEHVQEFDNFNKYRLSNHSKILFLINRWRTNVKKSHSLRQFENLLYISRNFQKLLFLQR